MEHLVSPHPEEPAGALNNFGDQVRQCAVIYAPPELSPIRRIICEFFCYDPRPRHSTRVKAAAEAAGTR